MFIVNFRRILISDAWRSRGRGSGRPGVCAVRPPPAHAAASPSATRPSRRPSCRRKSLKLYWLGSPAPSAAPTVIRPGCCRWRGRGCGWRRRRRGRRAAWQGCAWRRAWRRRGPRRTAGCAARGPELSSPSACATPWALRSRTACPCPASAHPAAGTGSTESPRRSRRRTCARTDKLILVAVRYELKCMTNSTYLQQTNNWKPVM